MDTSKVMLYASIGSKDVYWYDVHERLFTDLFGVVALPVVTKLFAATSINTSLKANITLFRKALYEIRNDLPIGAYLPNIQKQLARVRAGLPLSGRKISNFAAAMAGDKNAVVVDIWLLRAFGEDRRYFHQESNTYRSGGATDGQYTAIEQYVTKQAYAQGLQPRQLCAAIWSGCRIHYTGDRNTRYAELLSFHFNNLFNTI